MLTVENKACLIRVTRYFECTWLVSISNWTSFELSPWVWQAQWVGCHSPEVPCAPLAASAELTSMRALSPGPKSARLLAAGVGRRVSPQCFCGQYHGTHFMCLMGHRPRYSLNQTKIFVFDNSSNVDHENNNNDKNKKSILMIISDKT